MLLQFTVENFLSFREEAVLNLTVAEGVADRSHSAYTQVGGERVLRCVALYGPNASGKSNLIRALDVARRIVVEGYRPNENIDVTPFRLDESWAGRPSRFSFHYQAGDSRYEYAFSARRSVVEEEALYRVSELGSELVFERVDAPAGPQFTFGESLRADAERAGFIRFVGQGTRKNQLFLTEAAERNVAELAEARAWFERSLFVVYPHTNEGFGSLARLLEEAEAKAFFSNLLAKLDLGIDELVPERTGVPYPPADEGVRRRITLEGRAHDELDEFFEDESGEMIPIALRTRRKTAQRKSVTFDVREESDGTQRLLELLRYLYFASGDRLVLVVDELERSLHPLMTRLLVETFLGQIPQAGRQLIFTTHDTNLLNRSLLPPDAVWFVQKDAGGASKLHSLAEFQPAQLRELTGRLEEGYLQGRFGAIPLLGDPTSAGWLTAAEGDGRAAPGHDAREGDGGDEMAQPNEEDARAETDDAAQA
jgi:uncharacterized protein